MHVDYGPIKTDRILQNAFNQHGFSTNMLNTIDPHIQSLMDSESRMKKEDSVFSS